MSTISTQKTLPAGTWNADPVHSQLGFEIAYMGGTFRGTFSPFEATLEVASDGTAHLEGSARVEHVKVQDPNLEAHLQSPDFFDAERFPELRFSSDELVRSGDEIVVRGDLTIRGETHEAELRGTVADGIRDGYGNERVRLSLRGTVDRHAFGVSWNMQLPGGEAALPGEVTLTGELSLVGAQA